MLNKGPLVILLSIWKFILILLTAYPKALSKLRGLLMLVGELGLVGQFILSCTSWMSSTLGSLS